MTPEHLHVAINHLSFLGPGIALIPLVIGLLTGHRIVVFSALCIAILTGWTTPLTVQSGKAAYQRYEHGPIAVYLDANAEPSLDLHEERAEIGSIFLYANAVLTTILLGLLLFFPNFARIFALIAIISCGLALGSGIWIADSGGKIRRPDFRSQTPPSTYTPTQTPEKTEATSNKRHKEDHDEDEKHEKSETH